MVEYVKIDLAKGAIKHNPAAAAHKWRENGEVIQTKIPLLGRSYLVLSHAAVGEMLKAQDRFVMDPTNANRAKNYANAWWIPKFIKPLLQNMLQKDDPDHKRLRKLVDHAFSRRGVAELKAMVETVADDHLNRLPQSGSFDFADLYARDFPLTVICHLLGLPLADHTQFKRVFGRFSNSSNPAAIAAGLWGLHGLMRYLRDHLDTLRHKPNGSLISDLVELNQDGESLSEDELIAMVFLLFAAGHETTTHLLSGGTACFLDHPDQKHMFLTDETVQSRAVEECLRYVCPVQMTKPRLVAEKTNLAGFDLDAGDQIVAILATANMDADKFDAPDVFDITRKPNSHLGFGTGPHFCLGFQLARFEAQVSFQKLFERYPNLRRAYKSADRYTKRVGIRALSSLELKV